MAGRGQQGGKAGALGSGTADRSGMTQSQSLPLDKQPMSRALYGMWPLALASSHTLVLKLEEQNTGNAVNR